MSKKTASTETQEGKKTLQVVCRRRRPQRLINCELLRIREAVCSPYRARGERRQKGGANWAGENDKSHRKCSCLYEDLNTPWRSRPAHVVIIALPLVDVDKRYQPRRNAGLKLPQNGLRFQAPSINFLYPGSQPELPKA